MTEKFVCDFCSDKQPRWNYPCETFLAFDGEFIGDKQVESLDSWLACDECHTLIQADKWNELAMRCAIKLQWDIPFVTRIHDEFRQHRNGEPAQYGTG